MNIPDGTTQSQSGVNWTRISSNENKTTNPKPMIFRNGLETLVRKQVHHTNHSDKVDEPIK